MRDQDRNQAPVRPSREDFAYFMQAENGGPVKIGHAWNPIARMEIFQVAHPETLVLRSVRRGGFKMERFLHGHYADQRIRGEWFNPNAEMMQRAFVIFEGQDPGRQPCFERILWEALSGGSLVQEDSWQASKRLEERFADRLEVQRAQAHIRGRYGMQARRR